MTRAGAWLLAAAGLLSVTSIAAVSRDQAGQRPVRDLRPEPVGSGAISGVVQEDGAASRPLRRAAVRLSGEPLLTSRLVYTRDDGSFAFEGLPAGQYTVSARRASFMTAEYGARRPGGAGSAIVLTDGQRLTDLTLRLSRYGAISGVIYDQDGEPAAGISVEALRYTMRTGRRTLSSVYGQPATTDDRGVYMIGGLSPGEYFVAAGPSPDRGPMDVQRLSNADVDRVLQALVASPNAPMTAVSFEQPHQAFAPVFFPGSTDFSGAQRIALALGEERSGVDIRLQLVPTARIDGALATIDGRPLAGTRIAALAVTEASSMDLFSANGPGQASTDAQGRFSFPAVPPGRYVITARVAAAQAGQGSGVAAGAGPMWAAADVAVSGSDHSVALVLQPGMTLTGQVVFAGTTLQPPANLAGVRISMLVVESGFGVPLSVTPAIVNADATFTFRGVPPGTYRLASAPPLAPAGWAPRSAVMNGVDVFDVPFTVSAGRPVDNVVLTFTDRPTELSGTLQAAGGAPTADYFIIVFATDRAFWGPSTRRSTMARPASTGRYVIRNLPSGEYFVAAVTDVEQGDWYDAAFLDRLVPAATRITLSESEKKTLDLRIAGGR